MDVTVALGIGIAFAASVIGTLLGSDEVYFDSVTMFVFLLLGGRYLEIVARQRAASSLQHLDRLAPEFAHRLRDFPASLASERVPAVTLRRGDRVLSSPARPSRPTAW
jgi:P-type Cu2+ transporter